MKVIKVIILLGFMIAGSITVFAQDPPLPPAPDLIGESNSFFNGFLKISKEDENEYLKNASPEIKEYFKQIKESDEHRYYSLLREYYFSSLRYPMMRKLEADMQNNQKEIIEQEIMTEAFAAKYKKANSDEKQKIRQDLERSLTALFDLKENQREIEVRELEAQLKELKDKMNVRNKNRAAIFKRRMEELLGDSKYLEWE